MVPDLDLERCDLFRVVPPCEELVEECLGRCGIVVALEPMHEVWLKSVSKLDAMLRRGTDLLFPAVHGLLELLLVLVEQHIDDAQVGDIAVLLKVLSDLETNHRGGDVERVEGDNLGGLRCKSSSILYQMVH